ncbi:hypothetical protein C0995_004583 [Termitomyces sp. Mi166|nr:hypothetical protein C0995_004583 [Termitomyces sp. Mi166\
MATWTSLNPSTSCETEENRQEFLEGIKYTIRLEWKSILSRAKVCCQANGPAATGTSGQGRGDRLPCYRHVIAEVLISLQTAFSLLTLTPFPSAILESQTTAAMARDPPLLTSTAPTAIAPTEVVIGHVLTPGGNSQLRDLIICPRERGVVNYVQHNSIVEHNLNAPDSTPRPLVKLQFDPNTLSSLPIEGTDDTLLAAGGQKAEIHLSYHSPLSARYRQNAVVWHKDLSTSGSINNSVLLTSMSLTRSNESSVEPRLCISNNDSTVKLYNVSLRRTSKTIIDEVGCMHLGVPINHSSISPDGRTILSVGDSSKVHLHRMTGGAAITFSSIATLKLPSPTITHMNYTTGSLTASFSTAFSSDGSKFAVTSQEGLLAVWDVRSSKPLKIFQTEKSRMPLGNGGASGWLVDDIFDWTEGSLIAPGWSVRNVKFGGSGDKELMTFTEHTSLLHVVDARTFETEEIIQVPAVQKRSSPIPVPAPAARSQSHLSPPSYILPRPSIISHTHHAHSRLNPVSPSRQSTFDNRSSQVNIRALGDTFRISSPYSAPSSISDSTWRALRMSDSTATVSNQEGDVEYNDILIIPPFGDPVIENDVQALLGSHGFRTRQQYGTSHEEEDDPNTGSTHGDYEYTPRPTYVTVNSRRGHEDDIEVDELESCAPSRTPSRSSSPSPSTHLPTVTSPVRFASPALSVSVRERVRRGSDVQPVYREDLDIAGTCFDPSGKHIYVASSESVVEWSVRGAEKRWWAGSQWR